MTLTIDDMDIFEYNLYEQYLQKGIDNLDAFEFEHYEELVHIYHLPYHHQ